MDHMKHLRVFIFLRENKEKYFRILNSVEIYIYI